MKINKGLAVLIYALIAIQIMSLFSEIELMQEQIEQHKVAGSTKVIETLITN